ncbi:MAG TPA: HAMP domain-containing protein [Chloroflexus aurantiacus]|jgi:two-component system OmpR family sensor kinase/two-component system sensor histidine kinase BaeS|uniref:histidine kinase n=1 Tax=Chloroflexus aurantiacus (strain ATCC 29366 / DSM 635 / J-10-fl) TaxID=324602 RepID=A9WH13_CHLAA|nr:MULTISPECIES: ATP-binding protein [Chloroflexus]ABY34108.1 Histidine kinase [Chloroflexus aurantiacus J-10-fl]RMG53700.1 MAG: HAMP domain-containing protein [Chloroflexota bacterium]HBW68236.1 HAMP domain-containing protein [Chloroflexus aurantiacus]
MRPPRLFNLMLTAFALVIVLGISGMALAFWLVVGQSNPEQMRWMEAEAAARTQAAQLAAYYQRVGSWRGVERQLGPLPQGFGSIEGAVSLLDENGRVVAGRRRPMILRGNEAVLRIPIVVNNQQVGTLVISVIDTDEAFPVGNLNRRPLLLGMLSAGAGLMAVLLVLAAIFSRQISTPLRQISAAAHAIADGDHSSRVQTANVRELADLSASFNRMAEALQQADQQRRQLTADIAHELRTPLSIIKGRLEGIQDGVYEADAEQIEALLTEVALLERLINDLHLLALADAGQLPLYREVVSPQMLVNEAIRSFTPAANERNVRLSATIDDNLPDIEVDPQRIAQVLGNLIGNALRHTPAGGEVIVSAHRDESGIRFEVRDTGAGIDPADLPYIFDRFYKADRARSRSSGGAGLGLAIARRLVEAHGGQIWATSALQQGTTVSFRLPVSPTAPEPANQLSTGALLNNI